MRQLLSRYFPSRFYKKHTNSNNTLHNGDKKRDQWQPFSYLGMSALLLSMSTTSVHASGILDFFKSDQPDIEQAKGIPAWYEDKFESARLQATELRYLPADTALRLTRDIVIPPYKEHLPLAVFKDHVEMCDYKSKAVIRSNLYFHAAKAERVIPAGTVLKIDSVRQEAVSDKNLQPTRFTWYRFNLKAKDLRYFTVKVSSKKWRRSSAWRKVNECGAINGFQAADLEALTHGFFQVHKIPTTVAVGNSPSSQSGGRALMPRPMLGVFKRINDHEDKLRSEAKAKKRQQKKKSDQMQKEQNVLKEKRRRAVAKEKAKQDKKNAQRAKEQTRKAKEKVSHEKVQSPSAKQGISSSRLNEQSQAPTSKKPQETEAETENTHSNSNSDSRFEIFQ